MSTTQRRRLKYYLRLPYPVRVVARGAAYTGWFPDLPTQPVTMGDIRQLHVALDAQRVRWISDQVAAGAVPPRPNSHTVEGRP